MSGAASMGDKTKSKTEKKRSKAEYKLAKKGKKFEAEEQDRKKIVDHSTRGNSEGSDGTTIKIVLPGEKEKPWYKNPNWIRAIVGAVTMVVVVLTFYLTYR